MSSNDQHPRGPFVGCLAAAILLAPFAYVLSIGPAVWHFDHGYLPNWVGRCYWPIDWLYITFPPAKTFFDWYLQLFGRSP